MTEFNRDHWPQLLEDMKRQQYLEELYQVAGRADRAHPMHGLYTGLIEERKEALIRFDRDFMLTALNNETPY